MTFVQPLGQQQVQVLERAAPSERIRPSGYLNVILDPSVTPIQIQSVSPGIGFEVRVFDILNPNGPPIAVVPNPQIVQFEDTLSDVGSGTVTISTEDVPSVAFAKDNLWRVYWLSNPVFAFLGSQLQDTQIQGSEAHLRVVAGNGIGQALDWMKTYPGNFPQVSGGPAPSPTQTFTNSTRANIIALLLAQGKARGTLPWVTQYLWNKTRDSINIPWTDVHTLSVDAGTSMLELVRDYATAGPFDWHMDQQGRLALWNHAGSNRVVQIRVAPVGSILSAQITTDYKNLWDVVLVEDSNKGFTEQKDNTSVATFGRRENFNSSNSVLDSTGRADLGFSLLQQWKSPAVQKVVQIDTAQIGRRPYIDYFLGDVIAAEFTDGSISAARVIAIAMSSVGSESGEEAELTLDFMLSQISINQGGTGSSAITDGTGGIQVVYADNTGSPENVNATLSVYLTLVVQAFTDTFCEVFTSLQGTLSAQATITARIRMDTTIMRTITHVALAGPVMFTPIFMIPAVPANIHTMTLELAISAGTLSIPDGDLQFWAEGPNLNGGVGGSAPEIQIVDTFTYGSTVLPQNVSTAFAGPTTQTPRPVHPPFDIVHAYQTVTDNDGAPGMLVPGYVISVAALGDDGATSSIPSFTNSATQLEVGNDGGLIWGSYMRFIIPTGGIPTGATIVYARLAVVGDQNDSGVIAVVHGERAASPTSPTSRADFLARTRTTASVAWSTAVTSGTAITSPDFTNIIQELVTAYGNTITAITLFVEDNSSPLNGKMLWRSVNNSANQPPVLTIRWHQ